METSRIEPQKSETKSENTIKSETTIKPMSAQGPAAKSAGSNESHSHAAAPTGTAKKDTEKKDAEKKDEKNEKSPSAGGIKSQIRAVTQSDWISDVSHRAEDMNQGIQSFLKKNPVAAVAVAVGIGFAGSLLMKKLGARKAEAQE